MNSPPRILTLTTDLGTADGYVGAMKGRILSITQDVAIHDISHEIPPQDVWRGAWCLRRAGPRFPPGTVHLAVVDPDVGSMRSGVVIETEHYLLVGPDNGLLSLAARDDGIRRVVEISEESEGWRKSASFDGATLFAPVAGFLVAGMPLDDIGPDAEDLVEWPEEEAAAEGSVIEGSIVLFDRFGNAITNIPASALQDRRIERIFLRASREAYFCTHYAQLAGNSRIGALINSDHRLELALYGKSLQAKLELRTGEPVRVLLGPA